MGCNCGKPKCDGHCGVSPAVLQINNPSECTLFHRVEVPASMGDSKTNPPKNGAYKNVLLYYEADQTSWLYSSDGIPVRLTNGITNYEDAINLPQINGETLIGDKNSADLKLADAPMVITIASGNTSWSGADTAEDIYNFFLNQGKVNVVFDGSENYGYEIVSVAYIPGEQKMMCMTTVAGVDTGSSPVEFTGNALYGLMTFYTVDKAVDVGELDLQPKLSITDFTGLNMTDGYVLEGVPATVSSIGMVKPGDGLSISSDGTLTVIDHVFDTVADMKASENLISGSYAQTLGYHTKNDGGGAFYKIGDTGTANEMDIIAVQNDLIATFVPQSSLIRPEQFGAYCDGVHDDTDPVQACLNYGKPVTFSNSTLMLQNIEVPANSVVYFNKTVLKRITAAEVLDFVKVFENVNFYGDLELDGQKIVGNETASAVLLRLAGSHCKFNGYIKAHDSLGHGLSMGSNFFDTFINVVEAYDNGRFRVSGETNGIGDGIAIINGYDVHVNKIIAYGNGRNGTSICSYGTPMKNIIVEEICSGGNDYFDIDLELSNDVIVKCIRGYDTYYPNISLNNATNDKLENGEIRFIYGEHVSNIIVDNFTVNPDRDFAFYLNGSDIKLSNINITDSRENIGGYQLQITDSGKNGYIKDVYIDHAFRGYNLTVKNLENLVVGEYTSDLGQINSRWSRSADAALQGTVVLRGGQRSEHVTAKPTATQATVGDIAYLNSNSITAGGTFGYFYNGSAWLDMTL